MKNDIFSSEIVSGFGEPGGTSPPKTPGGYLVLPFVFFSTEAEE